jgi:hypothetical protein
MVRKSWRNLKPQILEQLRHDICEGGRFATHMKIQPSCLAWSPVTKWKINGTRLKH